MDEPHVLFYQPFYHPLHGPYHGTGRKNVRRTGSPVPEPCRHDLTFRPQSGRRARPTLRACWRQTASRCVAAIVHAVLTRGISIAIDWLSGGLAFTLCLILPVLPQSRYQPPLTYSNANLPSRHHACLSLCAYTTLRPLTPTDRRPPPLEFYTRRGSCRR